MFRVPPAHGIVAAAVSVTLCKQLDEPIGLGRCTYRANSSSRQLRLRPPLRKPYERYLRANARSRAVRLYTTCEKSLALVRLATPRNSGGYKRFERLLPQRALGSGFGAAPGVEAYTGSVSSKVGVDFDANSCPRPKRENLADYAVFRGIVADAQTFRTMRI